MENISKAFVAYPSKDELLSHAIDTALNEANVNTKAVKYHSWIFNDIPGRPLIDPIKEQIEKSSFIVADITYLNLNVVYEVGYAIGQKKRVFLVRNSNMEGDRKLATRVGIFDTLGYFSYTNANSLCRRLIEMIEETALKFEDVVDTKTPVYVLEPPVKGDAATMMTSRLKKTRYRYRSFNPSEDSRLSAMDAIRQVACSAGILVSFETEEKEWALIHNIRTMFIAGLAMGMNKPCLILAPTNFNIPLDVRDDVVAFSHPDDILESIAEFALEITSFLQNVDPPKQRTSNALQNLVIGDPTAENEMTTLGEYYMCTDQFYRVKNGEVNLVVGRKGSGKTALFLQLRDQIRSDRRNLIVDLKPEGYQLIKLKEDLLIYVTEGAGQHLITAFWEYLLLLELTYKILENDRHIYKNNHKLFEKYVELEKIYKVDNFSMEGDFSERLSVLSNQIAMEYQARFSDSHNVRLNSQDITSLVYSHDIKNLQQKLKEYLDTKNAIWILFDNLDKGWNPVGVDHIDIMVLRCLLDAGRKIERDMQKLKLNLKCVIFIRNDVYELLMKGSADYGKDSRAVLDWTDSDMLREVLRLRFQRGMNVEKDVDFEQLWREICISHYNGEETSSYFIERSLMRPRNLLKVFLHCKYFANSFNHSKIEKEDIEKGLRAYADDLLVELDHELSDICPYAPDLLYNFINFPKETTKFIIIERLLEGGVSRDKVDQVFEFLLYYAVIGLKTDDRIEYIYDVQYNSKLLVQKARIQGASAKYAFNPIFCKALGMKDAPNQYNLGID